MTRKLQSPMTPLIVTGIGLAAAMVGAFALLGDVIWGVICGGIVLAYVAVVVLGRGRSSTLEALSGVGDERTEGIALRAGAIAGWVMVVTVLVWWIAAIATGSETDTLTIVGAVYGAAFIIACAVLQRRS